MVVIVAYDIGIPASAEEGEMRLGAFFKLG
jgi:hypothetical protein